MCSRYIKIRDDNGTNPFDNICAIYVRQSTKEQTTNEDQIQDCIQKILEKFDNYTYAFIFEDKASSWKPFSTKRLKGLHSMLDRAYHNTFSRLFIYDASRLTRNIETAINILKVLDKHNIHIFSVIENENWSSRRLERESLMRRILEAQSASSLISERVKSKMDHLKRKGHDLGTPKFGQKIIRDSQGIRKFVVNQDEVSTIRTIQRMYKNKKSIDKITGHLNKQNKTFRGRIWTDSKIKIVLKNNNTFNMDSIVKALR